MVAGAGSKQQLNDSIFHIPCTCKVDVKFTLEHTMIIQKRSSYSATLSLTSVLDVRGWSTPRPCCSIPGKENLFPHYRRLCLPYGIRSLSPPRKCIICNPKYCLLLLHVSATIRLLQGIYLNRNAFVLNAVRDVPMWSQNKTLFIGLIKCIKISLITFILHLKSILCLVTDIYITTGFFILKGVIILKIIKNINHVVFIRWLNFRSSNYKQLTYMSCLCDYISTKNTANKNYVLPSTFILHWYNVLFPHLHVIQNLILIWNELYERN
jgi:hypothetical protein